MANLFDLTLRLAALLGVLMEGTATGGSTTTLIDTVDRNEDDDIWRGGTLWITYDAAGAGAAPEGEMVRITSWVNSTHTMTIPTLTAAVAAGDLYAAAKRRYSLWLLKQKINEALNDLGDVSLVDTSLTVAGAQTEYTLPLTVGTVRQVLVQTIVDTDDNRWTPIHNFSVQHNGAGVADTLIIPQMTVGRTLKVISVGAHPKLRATTDKLNDMIPVERVLYEAGKRIFSWKMKRGDFSVQDFYNELSDKAKQAEVDHPIIRPSRTPNLVIVK